MGFSYFMEVGRAKIFVNPIIGEFCAEHLTH